ncbi:TetR/AcrR family transcriptional regulator [Paenibacillus thailandensis]|uniref:TetR/AcrR family transcriptional regulator n=1 Tax=Paenibacillus thailandensis TaxID=393250 RepID=A0ABW5QZD5_9BACL
MPQQKPDRRISKTKKAIVAAFTELIEDMGFEALTVRDITEKADINRSTFYLHYRDKYDLLEKCEEEIYARMELATSQVKAMTSNELKEFFSGNEPFPFIANLIGYFQQNAYFMKTMLGPKGDPSFQMKIKEIIAKNITENVLSKTSKGESPVPTDIFIAYMSSALLGVIQNWLNAGMKQTPRELASILFQMMVQGPVTAMGLRK